MRIEQITFTRFLAAFSIVIFHYGLKIFPFNNEIISFIFKNANIGVSYFFLLSGFVMIIAYANKSKLKFFEFVKNRFARIYPVYLLAIILTFFYVVLSKNAIDFKGLILNLFLLQAWFPGKATSFNGPGWSLSVEFFFYFLFPFLLNAIYNKKKIRTVIFPILLIWVISQIFLNVFLSTNFYEGYPSKTHDFIFYFPLMHLNEFLFGNLTGLIFIKISSAKKNYDWLIFIIAIFLILWIKNPLGLNFHNGLLSLLFAPLILLISLNEGNLTKILNIKFFIFLGEISFGMYILQYPVFIWIQGVFKYFHVLQPLLEFYLALLILLIVSAGSYVFIETPLRKKIQNFHLK
jgi:peptidoglycan/LPS O-acetylase OafA/YrhL